MDYEQRKAWVKTLDVGSEVGLGNGYGTGALSIVKVARLTPTQLVLNDPGETRINRETGRVLGKRYRYIEQITDEVLRQIADARLRSWWSSLRYEKEPPPAVIERMKAIYDAEMAKHAPTTAE